MTYLSVCSGIEAATVAWHPLGWTPVAFSEIAPFPRAVLAQHYPHVPNWGDMIRFQEWPDAVVDVLVGGTPCQSFSVAGLRQGLDDPRGSLMLVYLAIARRYRPRWLVWENVPGVLSADDGRAFGTLLGGLAELGYGFAYRVLDAQHFDLAQRRARVFVVGYFGDWRRAAAVLFERESLSGHPAPRRETGEGIAAGATLGAAGGRNRGLGNANEADALIPEIAGTLGGASQTGGFRTTDLDNIGAYVPEIVPQAMSAKWSKGTSGPAGDEVANLIAPIAFSVKDSGADAGDLSPTLRAGEFAASHANGGVMPAVAFADVADPITAHASNTYTHEGSKNFRVSNVAIGYGWHVRRLTPRECERLQGFPDDYTLVRYRGGPAKDAPRYKALGNAQAVPVVRWIGARLAAVDGLEGGHA